MHVKIVFESWNTLAPDQDSEISFSCSDHVQHFTHGCSSNHTICQTSLLEWSNPMCIDRISLKSWNREGFKCGIGNLHGNDSNVLSAGVFLHSLSHPLCSSTDSENSDILTSKNPNFILSVRLILSEEKENREWWTYATSKHHVLFKTCFQ